MKSQEAALGFAIQDAARLRFLNPWDAAGLKVEAIGNLIVRGELPFSFMDVPVMAVQPRLPSTYEQFCTQCGIPVTHRATYQRMLFRSMGWSGRRPTTRQPGAPRHARGPGPMVL